MVASAESTSGPLEHGVVALWAAVWEGAHFLSLWKMGYPLQRACHPIGLGTGERDKETENKGKETE